MMKYFKMKELYRSEKALAAGIDNTPDEAVERNLTKLTERVLEPLRELYGEAVVVTSGYRCAALNRLVGGAPASQHCLGEAADITALNKRDNALLFEMIRKHLPFDQLIWERGTREYPDWIHVSYRESGGRRQVLRG
jgi:hypothetical protein